MDVLVTRTRFGRRHSAIIGALYISTVIWHCPKKGGEVLLDKTGWGRSQAPLDVDRVQDVQHTMHVSDFTVTAVHHNSGVYEGMA